MCGRVSKNGRSYLITSNRAIPNELLYAIPGGNHPTRRIPISEHRFIRKENLSWWSSKLGDSIHPLFLDVDAFYEKNIRFPIDQDKGILCWLHRARFTKEWVVSIITQQSTKEVAMVHHRMPVLVLRNCLVIAS